MRQANGSTQVSTQISKGLVTTALLVVVLWGIAQARPFLVPLSIAALLAFMMAPLVRTLRRVRVPELVAIVLSLLVMLLPLSAVIYGIVRQSQAFAKDLPSIIASLEDKWLALSHSSFVKHWGLAPHLDPTALVQRLGASAGQGVQLIITGLGALLNAGSQLALVLLFTVMMLASRVKLRHCSDRIVSGYKGIESKTLLDDVTVLIERFLTARLLIVAIIAALDFGVLAVAKIPYAFLLAAFLGLMTLVPAVGFLVGVIPPIVVSLATGHGLLATLLMTGGLIAMSAVENYALTPMLVGGRLNINALATFVGLFAGGLLWGIWGMLLSVPILGVLRIVFSAIPEMRPWGELLADKTVGEASPKQIRRDSRAA